jgi:large subunit ribosomal protein L3
MISGLMGKKLGMTRIFLDEGHMVPVTVLKVGPCKVVKIKSAERDGSPGVQLGFGQVKEKRLTKPLLGHFKAAGVEPMAHLKEFKADDAAELKLGQEIGADIFQIGEIVHVRARSKGHGFQGVMKRWGFHGGKASHGAKTHRAPGSIGSSAEPSKVVKGKKLPGRMGNQNVMIKNLQVMDVRLEDNIILVKGAVPGSTNSLVTVYKTRL